MGMRFLESFNNKNIEYTIEDILLELKDDGFYIEANVDDKNVTIQIDVDTPRGDNYTFNILEVSEYILRITDYLSSVDYTNLPPDIFIMIDGDDGYTRYTSTSFYDLVIKMLVSYNKIKIK